MNVSATWPSLIMSCYTSMSSPVLGTWVAQKHGNPTAISQAMLITKLSVYQTSILHSTSGLSSSSAHHMMQTHMFYFSYKHSFKKVVSTPDFPWSIISYCSILNYWLWLFFPPVLKFFAVRISVLLLKKVWSWGFCHSLYIFLEYKDLGKCSLLLALLDL